MNVKMFEKTFANAKCILTNPSIYDIMVVQLNNPIWSMRGTSPMTIQQPTTWQGANA